MIDTSIYKLIFIFSTSYFTDKLLYVFNNDKLKNLCVKYNKIIIDNKDDYYRYANFSTDSIANVERKFFDEARSVLGDIEFSILDLALKSLKINYLNIIKEREKDIYFDCINHLVEEFYLLCLENKINKDIFIEIDWFLDKKYLNLSENFWINSGDELDKYMIKIMGDYPDFVFDYYMDLVHLPFFKLFPYTIMDNSVESYGYAFLSMQKKYFYDLDGFFRNLIFNNSK